MFEFDESISMHGSSKSALDFSSAFELLFSLIAGFVKCCGQAWMKITGIAVFVPTGTEQKLLNVRCVMLEKELRRGNRVTRGTFSICLFFIIT